MPADIINFPNSKITVEETIDDVQERVKDGKVKHIFIVTVDHDTNTMIAMSSLPAYWGVYMAWWADKEIQKLMKRGGMIE